MLFAENRTHRGAVTRYGHAQPSLALSAFKRSVCNLWWRTIGPVLRLRFDASVARVFRVLVVGSAITAFGPTLCAAQAMLELPGAANFKEMRILDGERLIFSERKLKSLEENVKLLFISTSEKVEDLLVEADRLDFVYDEKTGELAQVAATGHVRFTMESSKRQLRADTVTWFIAENKAEFRRNPTIVSERGTLTGESITHYFSEDRTVVKKPRAIFTIPEKKEQKIDLQTPKKESQ